MVTRSSPHYVYMVRCKDGTLYTGYTNDLGQRLQRHNAGQGAKYTRGRSPVKLVYKRRFRSYGLALKAEWAIKSLSRKEKKALIIAGKKTCFRTGNKKST
ncbi:MAG: GIY-YIG nuclease family protein [bacterium]|nr:GIY-YIG nuclease family protein [bacterium]MDD5354478.1 GIY-YIG nuclease family protein [bacterium]MDD5757356.1 GIY-YIG nuclease family protein [bacterium]